SQTATDREKLESGLTAEGGEATPGDRAAGDRAPKDQEALLAHLGTSQESVDGLVSELRALEAKLEALSGERNQHRLLHEVCDSLAELGKLGAAQLFWGTREAVAAGEAQLGKVRERVTAFEKRIGELEARRQSTREQIDKAQYNVGLIEDE